MSVRDFSSLAVAVVPVTAFVQNCTIVMCKQTNKAAIIDPGGDIERIQQQLDAMGAIADKILLTHAHIDHVGGAAALAQQFGLEIIGPHQGDLFWIQGLAQQAAMFGFTKPDDFSPSQWLNDGDEVSVGNVRLQVIHTPGHTPGHVVFYSKQEQLAFVGDVLFNGAIGRTDFPQGNHQQLLDSIRLKLFPLGDEVEFYCGHGPNSTFGQERKSNPFVADHRG